MLHNQLHPTHTSDLADALLRTLETQSEGWMDGDVVLVEEGWKHGARSEHRWSRFGGWRMEDDGIDAMFHIPGSESYSNRVGDEAVEVDFYFSPRLFQHRHNLGSKSIFAFLADSQ